MYYIICARSAPHVPLPPSTNRLYVTPSYTL